MSLLFVLILLFFLANCLSPFSELLLTILFYNFLLILLFLLFVIYALKYFTAIFWSIPDIEPNVQFVSILPIGIMVKIYELVTDIELVFVKCWFYFIYT